MNTRSAAVLILEVIRAAEYAKRGHIDTGMHRARLPTRQLSEVVRLCTGWPIELRVLHWKCVELVEIDTATHDDMREHSEKHNERTLVMVDSEINVAV